MTLALTIKINDGIVLAADSASTNTSTKSDGTTITRIYNNANKVLHLHKDIPVGIITWGNGSIGNESIATIIKNFRKDIMSGENKIDIDAYEVEHLAIKFQVFLMEKYSPFYSSLPLEYHPYMGFTICGYSANADYAVQWRLDVNNSDSTNLYLASDVDDSGMQWSGQPEAIHRLVNGYTMQLGTILHELGIGEEKRKQILETLEGRAASNMINNAMPIKDAIDIAEFLIQMTVNFGRYNTDDRSVGGPIEIAVITKHEGFNWVNRKLYFSDDYNFRRDK